MASMEPQSRQLGVSDIDSDHSVFRRARLKLTAVYILIVAVIVIGFSVFLYLNLAQSLNEGNSIDGDFSSNAAQQKFISHTLTFFENDLILVDIVILLCTGTLGYWFAGYTLKPIQRSLEVQQTFSEKASHELRTPLAVMRNDFEVLLRNPAPTKELMNSALNSSIEEIDRLSVMTKDLLTLARSKTVMQTPSEKVNLTELAKSVVDKIQRLAENKGIHMSISVGKPIFVLGWPNELARVLTNLLQNAIEHTPNRGTIVLKVQREGAQAVVHVSDTGSGIDVKDIPRVFERFYKGESTNGSGLGLSIVKELVERHNGSIEISSIKNQGTVVTILLPIA